MQARCRQSPDGGGDGEGPETGGEECVRLREGRQQGESLTGGGYCYFFCGILIRHAVSFRVGIVFMMY